MSFATIITKSLMNSRSYYINEIEEIRHRRRNLDVLLQIDAVYAEEI